MQEILLLALVFSHIMIAANLSYTLMHNLNKASLFSISDVILQCSYGKKPTNILIKLNLINLINSVLQIQPLQIFVSFE